MPIYMDVHIVPGVKAKDVAEAHRKDLLHQEDFKCNCMTYWIDEQRENIFCLIEAPDKDAVVEMHNKAHGLVPNKVIEVSNELVESFLGRIYDPENAVSNIEGLKIFTDPSFRILLVTRVNDPALLQHCLGREKANEVLGNQTTIIRQNISSFGGREAEQKGSGFIISFQSATKAMACALAIQKDVGEKEADQAGLRITINAGEPIEKSGKLFGDTIELALILNAVSAAGEIIISSGVKELVSKDFPGKKLYRHFSP